MEMPSPGFDRPGARGGRLGLPEGRAVTLDLRDYLPSPLSVFVVGDRLVRVEPGQFLEPLRRGVTSARWPRCPIWSPSAVKPRSGGFVLQCPWPGMGGDGDNQARVMGRRIM